jgi:hypothetical protein
MMVETMQIHDGGGHLVGETKRLRTSIPRALTAVRLMTIKPLSAWHVARREAAHSKTASLALQPSLGGPKLH